MRDRTFGVEIECGTDQDGCGCECSCYTCLFCEYGCEESLGEDEECSCECACAECSYCRYGCEGDCTSQGCEKAADLLSSNGFNNWCYGIHRDGSGVEIPSPVLQGREGLNQLQRVMALLQDNGFDTTTEDGLHIHYGAPEWDGNNALIAHTIELWEENDELIRRFVDYYRRGTSWAHSRKTHQPDQWSKFKASKNLGDTALGHYFALNMDNLEYGNKTIEIRLHEGTLDFDKAAAWIRFGADFLEFAKRTFRRGEIVTCADRMELLRRVRSSTSTRRTLMAVA